jgi:DNA-binding FrmR family transcriptional regulator
MYNMSTGTPRGYGYLWKSIPHLKTFVKSVSDPITTSPGRVPRAWREGKIENHVRAPNKDILDRLKRIEGQIRGLQRMIESERDCTEIVTQVLAARSALEQVGVQLLDRQLHNCFPGDDPNLEPLRRSLRLWIKFGTGS